MRSADMRSVLSQVEAEYEPSPDFVEQLLAELSSMTRPVLSTRRMNVGGLVGMVAAALIVMIGLAVYVLAGAAPSALDTAHDSPISASPAIESNEPDEALLPLAIAHACDSFLTDVAAILRSGMGQPVAYASSVSGTTGMSAASLYELRDALSRIVHLYQLAPQPSPGTADALRTAISEFGEAALYVQLGEAGEAQRHLQAARSVLGDLSGAPSLGGCLEL